MDKKNINVLTGKFDLDVKNSLSPLFSLAKIYVMYVGKNPNGSIISKEAVERNIETLRNIPIVGEYVRENDNFLSHGGELTIEDDEIRFLHTTVPIGVVPSNAIFAWEKVIDDYGEEREYLVVENAFIWNRDMKMVESLKKDRFGQSMEINVTDGFEMNDGFFEIKDFYFTALCVLGIDRNGKGYVAPAFDNANIQTYSQEVENAEFAISLRDMFRDFKLALNDMDNLVEEDKKLDLNGLLEKFSLTIEDLTEKVSNYEDLTIEEIETALEKFEEVEEIEEVKEEVEEEVVTVEEDVLVEDEDDEAEKDVDLDSTDKDVVEASEYESEITLLEQENADLKSQIDSLTERLVEYAKADHERLCNIKIDEFKLSYKLDDEILNDVDVHKFESVEELETKLFEIVGRMAVKADFSKDSNVTTKIKSNLEIANGKNRKSYGFESLFELK